MSHRQPLGAPHQSALTLPAPAKINLALAVGPPAPPRGYHPIASIFAPITLGGRVRVSRADGPTFSSRWADDLPSALRTAMDWPPEKDLVVRAWRAIEAHVGRALPLAVEVVKGVPVGAGLGGGSSEAAAALGAINTVAGLGLSPATLRTIASSIGSDVAYFVPDGDGALPPLARVEGFGERITPMRIGSVRAEHLPLVLLCPPFGCPTGPVYAAFDAQRSAGLRPERLTPLHDALSLATLDIDAIDAALFNDLADAAMVVQPALRTLRDAASEATGRRVHVTGSGSTLFMLAHDAADQQRLMQLLMQQLAVVGPCTLLSAAIMLA
jgi:4-diphosphocytidyl-2-C-methyl-D-erythritol kinase